jgi:hypothetical protein
MDSVNSGCAANQQRMLARRFKIRRGGLTKFFQRTVFCFATTRALHFFSQGNFFGVIENKIHFFLVAFATDF